MTADVTFGTEPRTTGVRRIIWRLSHVLARVELAMATLGLILLVLLILVQAAARVGMDLGLAWPGRPVGTCSSGRRSSAVPQRCIGRRRFASMS